MQPAGPEGGRERTTNPIPTLSSARLLGEQVFPTAQLRSYEILGSVPDPSADNEVPAPRRLPPLPAARTPSSLPLTPCPPHSLWVIRFLSISRLRSLPAHLATKLRTHSWGRGGTKRGHMGVMGKHKRWLGCSGAWGMWRRLRPPKGRRQGGGRCPGPLPSQHEHPPTPTPGLGEDEAPI